MVSNIWRVPVLSDRPAGWANSGADRVRASAHSVHERVRGRKETPRVLRPHRQYRYLDAPAGRHEDCPTHHESDSGLGSILVRGWYAVPLLLLSFPETVTSGGCPSPEALHTNSLIRKRRTHSRQPLPTAAGSRSAPPATAQTRFG